MTTIFVLRSSPAIDRGLSAQRNLKVQSNETTHDPTYYDPSDVIGMILLPHRIPFARTLCDSSRRSLHVPFHAVTCVLCRVMNGLLRIGSAMHKLDRLVSRTVHGVDKCRSECFPAWYLRARGVSVMIFENKCTAAPFSSLFSGTMIDRPEQD